jgi:hypothetical protein
LAIDRSKNARPLSPLGDRSKKGIKHSGKIFRVEGFLPLSFRPIPPMNNL